MASMAFVSLFTAPSFRSSQSARSSFPGRDVAFSERKKSCRLSSLRMTDIHALANDAKFEGKNSKPRRVVGIVASKSAGSTKEKVVDVESSPSKGLFGMKANAYWDSMGVLPLFFVGFGLSALAIKMVKVKGGEMRSGTSGVNKVTIPKTAITTEEEEAELHVFKCGGCGYEMYPARGREFKFFPDSFKCPLCGTPKSEFWDLNDPDDPRNQEEEDEDDVIGEDGNDGPAAVSPEPSPGGGEEVEPVAKDRAETDTSA